MRQNARLFREKVLVVVAVLVLISSGTSKAAFAANLFSDVPSSDSLSSHQDTLDATVVGSRNIRINFDALKDVSIGLTLFEGKSYTALMDRSEKRSSSSYTWFGSIVGVDNSQVILTVEKGSMAGNITLPSGFYQIRDKGNGMHTVQKIDQSAFPSCATDDNSDAVSGTRGSTDVLSGTEADDGSNIDVMVVYTPAAGSASANIQSEIQLAIDETNQSYANSGITQRLSLVHTAQVTYTESVGSCSIYDYRNRLQNPSDGFMDNVHTLRDTHNADLVLLIVENGCGYCGVAYIMSTVSTSFENYGFAVAARSCATGYYSFGHEFGHIMSARHDWLVDSTNNSPYTYNHAYVDPADSWRTIMAYSNDCAGCPRIQYWSNPDVLYLGSPMGAAEGQFHAADNRKTFNNTAWTVANFRQSSVSQPTYYYDNYDNIYIEVNQLGTILQTEWAIVVKVDLAGAPPDIGIGFSFWNPIFGDLAIHVNGDDAWYSHTEEGVWNGSGSSFVLSVSTLHNEINTLTTSPQADASGDDPSSK